MKVIAVDDEARPLNLLRLLLNSINDVEYVQGFTNPLEAYSFIKNNQIDLAILDIEMPELNGLDLALMIQELPNPPQIAFITAYSQYAMEAWKTEAVDYVLKPYDFDQLKQIVERVGKRLGIKSGSVYYVKCFPHFDIIVDKQPIVFRSKRGKELLAYLVNNQNAWVDIGALVFDLFGDIDEKSSKSHYRVILSRLKNDLAIYGLSNLIETKYGKIRSNITERNCDYYRYLNGEKRLFMGEYMQEYSWAENMCAAMYTREKMEK